MQKADIAEFEDLLGVSTVRAYDQNTTTQFDVKLRDALY